VKYLWLKRNVLVHVRRIKTLNEYERNLLNVPNVKSLWKESQHSE